MSTKPDQVPAGALAPGRFLFLLVFALWLLLAGTLDLQELAAGLLVALAVTIISRPHLEIFSGFKLTPSALPAMLSYLGLFAVELVRANLDVARRVLSPSLPLRPALVEVRSELQSPLGRLILANSITLTPGTLTVDVRGERLLIHWIDAPPGVDLESATREIAGRFETHLRGFLK